MYLEGNVTGHLGRGLIDFLVWNKMPRWFAICKLLLLRISCFKFIKINRLALKAGELSYQLCTLAVITQSKFRSPYFSSS